MPDAAKSLLEARRRLLAAALPLAAALGFGPDLLAEAERAARLKAQERTLLFPDGAGDLIGFWHTELDATLERHAPALAKRRGTQARVAHAVMLRLQAEAPQRDAARAAAAWLALPPHWPHAAKHLYATSDTIWRAVRDSSVDGSFYSKRLILAGIYGATHLFWMEDDSPQAADTRAFLDRRLGELSAFAKRAAGVRTKRQERSAACLKRLGAWRYDRARKAS